jgi:cell fate regulator YaaT (PSP1 superfamily)
MGCSGCSTGRGNHNQNNNGIPAGCNNNGSCGTTGGCNKLNVFDWLGNMRMPDGQKAFDMVEIRFKNSRKDFFRNVNNLSLVIGDVVAVEATQGHDIGVVSLTGELVRVQMKKRNVSLVEAEVKKVYRKAKQNDIDKWLEAQKLEVNTMFKARTIALRLGLQMKLSDVEYQGDKSKAIFYYTADERVDFRELIKLLAEEFKVRIEMRQIGARQEASRLGGIGACGRELCCSTWLTDFRTVSTSAARYQQLSLNPLKLAGQCGKLKCCLNYELDSYVDALKEFPTIDNKYLQTQRGEAFHQKTDIFKGVMWFSYKHEPDVFIPMKAEQVKQVIAKNEQGEKPEDLVPAVINQKLKAEVIEHTFENVVGQDSLTRFDKKGGQRKPHHHTKNKQHSKGNQNNPNKGAQGNQNKNQGTKNTQGGPNKNASPQQQNKSNPNQNKPKPQHKPQGGPHHKKPNKPNNSNDKKD